METYLITVSNLYMIKSNWETENKVIKTDRTRMDLGRTNRRAVLAAVVLNGPLSRTGIAKITNLTAAAVSRITRDLIEAHLIEELPEAADAPNEPPRGPGRRFVELDVNPSGGYILGIGVNVFSQSITLADLKNRRIARHDLKLSNLTDPNVVINRLTEEANAIVDQHVQDRQRLFGASFAFTGAVDPKEGVVRTSPYLRWGAVALGERLTQALNTPVRIESLPAAVALAESKFGIAQGMKNLLAVNCSLGIGAAILSDGRLIRGHDFAAGLIGGIFPPGEPSGTLDNLASGHGILMSLLGDDLDISATPSNRLAESLLEAMANARNGDAATARATADAGRVLGETLAPFLALLHPQSVMISGPLAMVPQYVNACRQALAPIGKQISCELLISDLSAQAAARWVAIDEFLLERDLNLDDLKLSEAA